jgi:chaperone modulatory protein CbpM
MKKHELLIIADYSQDTPLTLEELCEVCHVPSGFIYDLIEYEIVYPRGKQQEEWMFDLDDLKRIQTILRLQRDLEVNLSGAIVVLDLLEELEELRAQIELMQKHFKLPYST